LTNFKPATLLCITNAKNNTRYNVRPPLSHLAPIRHQFGHEFPPPKDKKSALSNGQESVPMHEVEIIEELLARDDMLPAVVRRQPRAYLVPPRRNSHRSTGEEYGYDSDNFESYLTEGSPLPHDYVEP
jgi:hypothetical protein